MTRAQVFAKAMLTTLGIYGAVYLLQASESLAAVLDHTWGLRPQVWTCGLYTTAAVLSLYILAIRNDRLACWLAGPADALPYDQRQAFTIQALRLAMVFTGLMLLPSASPAVVRIVKIPFVLRPMISELIFGDPFWDVLSRNLELQRTGDLFGLVLAVLTAYLILGAPQFVHWQARHAPQPKPTETNP